MNSELRQLIVSKCRDKGLSVEQLAEISDCSLTELKGYTQGLFILDDTKLARLLQTLSVTREELEAAIGGEEADRYLKLQGSKLA